MRVPGLKLTRGKKRVNRGVEAYPGTDFDKSENGNYLFKKNKMAIISGSSFITGQFQVRSANGGQIQQIMSKRFLPNTRD
jgi:hypothetical protein